MSIVATEVTIGTSDLTESMTVSGHNHNLPALILPSFSEP